MALPQEESVLQALEGEADELALFVTSLDTCRLHMIGSLVNDELILRYEGKPLDKSRLH